MDFLNGHDKNSSANFARFLPKKGENLRAMLKCGRMELNVTLSQQLKKVFFLLFCLTRTLRFNLG